MSPSAEKVFRELGFKIYDVIHREKIYKNGVPFTELDTRFVAEYKGRNYLIIGEAKTTCTAGDIKEFKARLKKLKSLVWFKDYKIIGFISSVNYGRGADKFAQKEGLYTFYVTDDVMVLKVPKNFSPKEF